MVEVYRPTHSATLDAIDVTIVAKNALLKRLKEKLLAADKAMRAMLIEQQKLTEDLAELNAERIRLANPR